MQLSNKKLLSLLIAAAGFIWRLAVPAAAGRLLPCGGAMVCGLAAAVLAILYLMLFRTPSHRQAAEVGAVSIYLTFAYVAAALALNTWFVFRGLGGFNYILLSVNGVLAAGYAALVLFAEKNVQRLSRQLSRTEEKLSLTAELSAKISTMLGLAEDKEIRAQLLRLKEAVDYSSNLTTSGTIAVEKQLESQLNELLDLFTQSGEPALIQDKLREAERTWRTRSAAAQAK